MYKRQVIRRPANKVYLVSSATMCLVDALDANDNILMSGTKADEDVYKRQS